MSDANVNAEQRRQTELSSLMRPPARVRERTADDMEFDVADPIHDLPLDDSEPCMLSMSEPNSSNCSSPGSGAPMPCRWARNAW